VSAAQVVCVKCGVALKHSAGVGDSDGKKDKTVAALLAIFLGALGIHEFYLGNNTSAIIRLVITLLTCGWGGAILGIISLIEGIIYLTKSDEEFQTIYVKGHKEWF
jgi:TM2 domain-containing membrane protein YozV